MSESRAVAVQPLASMVKFVESVRATVTESGKAAVFVRVTVWVGLLEPTTTSPKESVAGLMESMGSAGRRATGRCVPSVEAATGRVASNTCVPISSRHNSGLSAGARSTDRRASP